MIVMMPLPFKQPDPMLPNNRSQALHRLYRLKQRFNGDKKYQDDCIEFMRNVIDQGFAEPVPVSAIDLNGGSLVYPTSWGVPPVKD